MSSWDMIKKTNKTTIDFIIETCKKYNTDPVTTLRIYEKVKSVCGDEEIVLKTINHYTLLTHKKMMKTYEEKL